jgi:hypothetical protein
MKSKFLRTLLAGSLVMGAFAVAFAQEPAPAPQEPGMQQEDPEAIIIVIIPETERDPVLTMVRRIPEADRRVMLQIIKDMRPELARATLRGLLLVDQAGMKSTAKDPGTSMSETEARDLLAGVVSEEDKQIFMAGWEGMTTEHKTVISTLIRDAHYGGFGEQNMATPPAEQTTPPAEQVTPPAEGARAQPFAVLPVPESGREAFMSLANELTPAEQQVHVAYLSKFQPDQAMLIVQGLLKLDEWGKAGGDSQNVGPSMSEVEARDVLMKAFEGTDQSTNFTSLWEGLDFDKRFMLVTLARDAYFGGFKDEGGE